MKIRHFAKFAALFAVLALVAGPALAFPCYCNGKYLGDYDSIMACFDDCEPSQQLDSDAAGLPTIDFLTPETPQASQVACQTADS